MPEPGATKSPISIFPTIEIRGVLLKREPRLKKVDGKVVEGQFNYFVDMAGLGFMIESAWVEKEIYDRLEEGDQVLKFELAPSMVKDGDYSRFMFRPRVVGTRGIPAPREAAGEGRRPVAGAQS